MGFSVGDRVEAICDINSLKILGKIGTIAEIRNVLGAGFNKNIIYFDDNVGGIEDISLGIPDGHCVWCYDDTLQLVSTPYNNSLSAIGAFLSNYNSNYTTLSSEKGIGDKTVELPEIKKFLLNNNISEKDAVEALGWYFKK